MLKSLRLRNFKSFADARAEFGPLTLLVGANASGKSNVLEAIRLLRAVGLTDLPLDWALQGKRYAGAANWPGIRGGIHEVARGAAETFGIESSWRVPGGQQVEHLLECEVSPRPLIRQEVLREVGASVPLFEARAAMRPSPPASPAETIEPLSDLTLFLEGGRREEIPGQLSARWSALGGVRKFAPMRFLPLGLAIQLQVALRDIRFLDMVPASMRRYVPQEMQELGESGENLSAVLWRLCQDAERKQELVTWLDQLCTPELADIEFSSTDEGEVMLRLVEKDGSRVSARSLSDGTLRFLGELVALRTAPEGSVILMEELGNGLHPRRIHLLVEYLEGITEEQNIQVIATTHSPLVLQALGKRARGDVVLLGRQPDVPGTVMRRLADLPGFEEVVERRGMEYLFTTGWLEQAL